MMVLLDTCALLFWATDKERLTQPARQAIQQGARKLRISSITALEIGLLVSRGKLDIPFPVGRWLLWVLEAWGIEEEPVTMAIGLSSAKLPQIHKDPFDRIIIATAQANDCALITSDEKIHKYPDTRVIW